MDSVNSISLAVVDAVAPQIAPKLIAIADGADQAALSVGNLKSQLAALKSAGLSSLSTMLTNLEKGSIKSALAQGTLAANIRATTSATLYQAAALGTNGSALTSIAAATNTANAAGKAAVATTTSQTAATVKGVSANIAGAASIGILEGRTLSMNRAATNFATKVLGLGPLLQAAFPIIGAVAMLSVLYQMGAALYKVTKSALDAGKNIALAFDGITNSLRKSTDELVVTNDKLDGTIARLQHKPTTNGIALAMDEARVMADKLDDSLERVQKDLDEVLKKNQINGLMAFFTHQGSTTGIAKDLSRQEEGIGRARDAADQANELARATADANNAAAKNLSAQERSRIAAKGVLDVQAAEITSYQNLRAAIKTVADERTAAYNKLKEQSIQSADGSQSFIRTARGSAGFEVTARLTELGKAAHLSQFELKNLDATQQNLAKSAIADTARDDLSRESAAIRQAAKDWKELDGAYRHFQESQASIGHKTTARENLDALNSLGAHNNPLNADKLVALKLPQENKLAQGDWVTQEIDKLNNQIAAIGLYNDALKEAQMMNTIRQEAQKRNITLTDAETASFKSQIATIVESKDYQRELEGVYDSINSAGDKYSATVRALNTAVSFGVITQEQYGQALNRTMRTFQESSSVIVGFQRKLDEQQRDAGNKLGSNQDIAAKAVLQQLAQEMRQGDANHPGGYTESDIQKVLASKLAEVRAQQVKNATDEEANKLIFAQTNLYDQLIVKEAALQRAVEAGMVSQQAANIEKLKYWNQQNDEKLKNGTGGSIFGGALADYATQAKATALSMKESFSGMVSTLGDGLADTLGRAVVDAKNLGQALKDVAKSAVSQLISSLIKLAIEYLIISKLQKALHIQPVPTVAGPTGKQAAEGVAGMAAITVAGIVMTKLLTDPMWSLAAAMAAVTFGVSAAAGAASITALGAAEQTAKAGHADGGYITGPGTGRSDSISAQLSNGEYVVNAAATSQHRDMLDAINSGSSRQSVSTKFAPQINASANGAPRSAAMKVEVHNYAGVDVQVQHLDEGQVRVMINQQVPGLITQHAPGVIADHISDPNSKVSKSIYRNVTPARVR
jgi:hypothetical protein